MPEITKHSSLEETAAIVSDALGKAGIIATLSGGSAVTIYTENEYLSRDLDFVTSAMVGNLEPMLGKMPSRVCRQSWSLRSRRLTGMHCRPGSLTRERQSKSFFAFVTQYKKGKKWLSVAAFDDLMSSDLI